MRVYIETDRLILRQIAPGDSVELFSIMMDYDTAKLAGFKQLQTYQEAMDLIFQWKQNELMQVWAIVEKDSNSLIGVLEEEITSSDEKHLGYWLGDWARGKGYMTEALSVARDRIFEDSDEFETIRLYSFPRNEASAAVARKCGFSYDGTTYGSFTSDMGDIEDLDHWSITRENWSMRRSQIQNDAENR